MAGGIDVLWMQDCNLDVLAGLPSIGLTHQARSSP